MDWQIEIAGDGVRVGRVLIPLVAAGLLSFSHPVAAQKKALPENSFPKTASGSFSNIPADSAISRKSKDSVFFKKKLPEEKRGIAAVCFLDEYAVVNVGASLNARVFKLSDNWALYTMLMGATTMGQAAVNNGTSVDCFGNKMWVRKATARNWQVELSFLSEIDLSKRFSVILGAFGNATRSWGRMDGARKSSSWPGVQQTLPCMDFCAWNILVGALAEARMNVHPFGISIFYKLSGSAKMSGDFTHYLYQDLRQERFGVSFTYNFIPMTHPVSPKPKHGK